MITDDGMVIGPVGGGGGGAFVAGPHPGRVKISVTLSCKEQVRCIICHVCRLLCLLPVWKCRISPGQSHYSLGMSITLNMQLSWRSIKFTDLDIYIRFGRKCPETRRYWDWSVDDNEWVLWNDIWYLGHFLSGNALKEMIDICLKWRVDVKFDLGCRAAE